MAVGRKIIGLWTVAMIGATLQACTSSGSRQPTAAATPTSTGPTVLGQQKLPPLVPRTTPSDAPVPKIETAAQNLSDRIDQTLARTDDPVPATRLSIKPAAGNQLQIAWVTGSTWPDPHARWRVREHVLDILKLVQNSRVHYGTVLLMATGPTFASGSTSKKKTSVVVRAKYSQPLVANTNWAAVTPSSVLGMCDDKPAVIATGYR